ncbi:hypothetical protein [Gordonia alkaliphila]|uniref:Uncharacterized protein n=1 Tax=Gordonia alkaliphila TaxID=1053547 RepID=A0ABP8ZBT9_9ACTN
MIRDLISRGTLEEIEGLRRFLEDPDGGLGDLADDGIRDLLRELQERHRGTFDDGLRGQTQPPKTTPHVRPHDPDADRPGDQEQPDLGGDPPPTVPEPDQGQPDLSPVDPEPVIPRDDPEAPELSPNDPPATEPGAEPPTVPDAPGQVPAEPGPVEPNPPTIPDWAEGLLPRELLERIPLDWWKPPTDQRPGKQDPGIDEGAASRIGEVVTWLLNFLDQDGAPDGGASREPAPSAPLDSDILEELMNRFGELADQAHEVVIAVLEALADARDADPANIPDGLEEQIKNLLRPTTWGSKVHKALEDLVSELAEQIAQSLGAGFHVYHEWSVPKGAPPRVDGDGNILADSRGQKNTVRPDIVVTQYVDGAERLVLIVDLKTGKSGISKTWIRNLQKSFDIPEESLNRLIRELRPSLPRPNTVSDEELSWL